MNDDKNTNQSNTTNNSSDNYQKIIDDYAATIKSENITKVEDKLSLKDINSLQIEAPEPTLKLSQANQKDQIIETPLETKVTNLTPEPTVEPEPEVEITPEPTVEPEPEVEITPEPTVEPEPIIPIKEDLSITPEDRQSIDEVKNQVNEILNYPTNTDNTDNSSSFLPPTKNNSPIIKILFFVSLFIFISIFASLAYFLTSSSKSTNISSELTPTVSPISTAVACSINGLSLSVGESFKAADGCNTCSCTAAPDVIACTEMACEATPTAKVSPATKSATVSPTKSATTSSIPKDWKTYTDKELGFSFNYPKNITLTKKSSNGTFSLAINTQVSLAGGVNMITGITVNRGGSSLDFGGYTKNGNQITYFYNKDKSTVCDSKLIKKIYNNPNGLEIVLLEGTISEELAGPCETSSGEIKALINIKNKTYPGLTFINNSLITESDLMKILDTLKFN